MAQGDVVVFQEARAKMISGDWASTDVFHIAICDNAATPTPGFTTPVLGDFTQVTAAGSYTTDGTDQPFGALSALVSEAAGTMTFDTTVNPTWAQHALNGVDAYWGIVFNYTDAGKDAVAYVDLDGPVDMTAGALTITWNASGMFTIGD